LEGEALLRKVETDPFVVVLDQQGRELDSNGLAALVEKQRMRGTKQITFVVGGFGGISQALARRADFLLSLSKVTLTHEMARLVIVEQVYRAFTILHRLPYTK
jgi:23S rRNA (pseudouridine1915-N3)-methyltransferase